ncbi:MAG: two pore domain potassium channel family protein [Sedimentisphaerales bacterium]|nr:two pore domain potassium channel family protein [Sedimentisphaerales bacterium]
MRGAALKRVLPDLADELSLLRSIWTDYWPRGFKHKVGWIEKIVVTLLVFRRVVSLSTRLRDLLFKNERCQPICTELMTIAWLVFLTLSVVYGLLGSGFVAIIVLVYLIWGSIDYPLCIIFLDRHKPGWKPQSYNRLLILLFVNYLQIIAGFAYLYLHVAKVVYSECSNALASAGDALYFSVVTITTLGFGDMRPLDSWAKLWVATEVLTGLVFLVLVVATVVALSTRE